MEWISVEDRIPENLDDVVVAQFEETMDVGFYDIAHYEFGQWWNNDGEEVNIVITHWMPLPESPVSADES